MQTASGNKSGHVLALIAVGLSAVADVCCCC
ncbi:MULTISPECIES: Ms4533A family Cys-rich leader peptide [Mycobacteriaceae]